MDALKGTGKHATYKGGPPAKPASSAKSMPMSFGSMPSQIKKRKQKKQRSKSRMKQRNPGSSSYSFGAKYPGKP